MNCLVGQATIVGEARKYVLERPSLAGEADGVMLSILVY